MNPSSSVVHLDADAFFASVEQASDPRLRGRPIAVGGEKRGIIASASYEARQFGIYTPMPTVRARKLCPRLVVLPGDYEKYERFSRWMFSYAYDFTPDVEIGSIDEGYLDLTAVRRPAVEIAATIRDAIRQTLKITVSEGIGTNKLISQIASKLHKPAAFQCVPAGQEVPFLHPLPNRWLPGVGPQTSVRLNAAGLTHIHQVAATAVDQLSLLVGRQAYQLRQFANAIDERPVVPASEPAKSYGQQETFEKDQTDEDFIEAVLRRMADHLFAKARADGKSVRTLTVKVRYNDMDEDQCAESLEEPTDLETDIYGRLHQMLRRAWQRRVSLRLVSLRLSNLYDGFSRGELALDRTAAQHEARHRLAVTVDALREEHGRYVVMRGHDLFLNEAAKRRNEQIGDRRSEIGNRLRIEDRRTESRKKEGSRQKVISRTALPRSANSDLRTANSPPLAVRSHYSFLDSTLSPRDIVQWARRHGLTSVVLCDLGNLHGAVPFTAAAKAAGLRPVLGAEIHVQGRPLRLYVENATGYANLCRWLSRLNRRAEIEDRRSGDRKSKPATRSDSLSSTSDLRISNFELRTPISDASGLIAVAADSAWAACFPGRFYLGVEHPDELRQLANPDRLPVVVMQSVHYGERADRWKFDIVQSIRTLTLLRQEHPEKRQGGEFHFRAPAETAALFREHPDVLRKTAELLERCQFVLPVGPPQFPPYQPPDGSSSREFLRCLVFTGLAQRYPEPSATVATKESSPSTGRSPNFQEEVRQRVETELAIIHEVGYEDYFLITWDMLQTCRERGISWITRGSAADSLVCYCLGISDVCPIRFELYFRRFLNKERMALNKLPDIDIDFPHDRKDDVIDLLFEKYGPEHCAVVGGFSTFQARSAFAEVAKVLGVAEREVRRFTEHFPWSFGKPGGGAPAQKAEDGKQRTENGGQGTDRSAEIGDRPMAGLPSAVFEAPPSHLVELLRSAPETSELPLDEEPYRSALVMAEFLDGVPRYAKMHPCGVVLSRQPMHELTPTFLSGKGWPTTHFDMDAVEAIGLVKMDILAQGGLAAMRDVQNMLRDRGLELDLGRCEVRKTKKAQIGDRRSEIEGPFPELRSANSDLRTPSCPPSSVRCFPLPALSPSTLTFDDPAVWDMISGGGARAVHHIESPAMTGLCRMCNVRDIDTLVAIVSVIRPGAANEDKKREFTRRYQGLSPVTYPHPSVEPCLRSTFGLVVYEEHILQICEAFAGLSGGRADVLRRALVKEKWETVNEIGLEFVQSARRRGHRNQEILQVWQAVTGFHGYAFCKAHSAAYGVEAWQSAWLKCYFPAEFMAAVLTNGKGFYSPLVYVLESWRLGLAMLPPSVQEPGPGFQVVREGGKTERKPATHTGGSARARSVLECASPLALSCGPQSNGGIARTSPTTRAAGSKRLGGRIDSPSELRSANSDLPPHISASIRVPVGYVKTLSESTRERMLAERAREPFASLAQFFLRVQPSREEMEALSRVGAFDCFGQSRCAQFWEIQRLVARWGHQHEPGQGWLFDMVEGQEDGRRKTEDRGQRAEDSPSPPSSASRPPSSHLTEPSRWQRLQWEVELLGFPASGHPLELYPHVAWETYCTVSRLGEFVGQEVTLCGLVIEDRVHHQSNGELMKFLTLCDWTGMIETELFAQTYRTYGLTTVRYPVLEVTGRVEPYENGRGFTLRVLRAGKPRERKVEVIPVK